MLYYGNFTILLIFGLQAKLQSVKILLLLLNCLGLLFWKAYLSKQTMCDCHVGRDYMHITLAVQSY